MTDPTTRQVVDEALIQMMQEISGRAADEYWEETILGSDVNQIRHLFYFLQAERRIVLVNYGADVYRSRVIEVHNTRTRLQIPEFHEEGIRRCRVKFEIVNVLYQFEVPILDIGDDWIEIRIPAFIQSATRRKNRRIFLDDMFMRFVTLYQPIYGTRGYGQIMESRYAPIVSELKKDEPDLYLIHRIMIEQIRKISPDFEVRFYKKGEKFELLESAISEEKKTLYIPDVQKLDNYFKRNIGGYGLINFLKEYQHQTRAHGEETATRYFEKLQRKDMQNFLASYVCTPMMIFDRVIGHIYIYSTVFDRRMIDHDQAFRVDMLVRLLNYAMSKTVIARSFYRHTYTRVMNISMSGLLFELNNQEIFDYLTFHDRLKMIFNIKHHVLEMHGEITRYLPTQEGFHVGVEFFKQGPDDARILESFIYDRTASDFG
ncbi:MAG: DUF1577 domain-containing protein [Leptospiraceae bacterium]|nr:DUF1577 domain-containing protein [Leptospiraceae bacterium]